MINIKGEFCCEIGDYIKGIGDYSRYKKFLVLNKKYIGTSSYKFLYDLKIIEIKEWSNVGQIYKGLALDNLHFNFYKNREDVYLLGHSDGL